MAGPVNHGFPPAQPSRGASSDSAAGGGVSDDVLRREQEYQELLAKRIKLFLDPAAGRAVAAVRLETERAAEAERKYRDAVALRMAAMRSGGIGVIATGNGVTGPMTAGPQFQQAAPPPINAQQAAAQQAATNGAMPSPNYGTTSPANGGPSLASRFGGATAGVMGGIGRHLGQAMDGVDAFNAPYTPGEAQTFNALKTIPFGIGDGIGALRRLQLSLQQYGSGLTREQSLTQEQLLIKGAELRDAPHEGFRMDYDVQRILRGVMAGDPSHAVGQWNGKRPGWLDEQGAAELQRLADARVRDPRRDPRGDDPIPRAFKGYETVNPILRAQRGDSLTAEYGYRSESRYVEAQRDESEAVRQLEAQKSALAGLSAIRRRHEGERAEAAARAIALEKKANGETNQKVAKTIRAEAAAQFTYAAEMGKKAIQAEDSIRSMREGIATQEARRQQAAVGVQRANLVEWTEREGVAASQAQRIGSMGPGARMGGQVMLKLLQQMQEAGQDLTMMPAEVIDMARSVAPETVRKMFEGAGEQRIKADRADGLLPAEEYRDDHSTARKRVNEVNDSIDKLAGDSMAAFFRENLQALTGMKSRFDDLDKLVRDAVGQLRLLGIYQKSE